jgi:hypothetical protein
MVEIPLENILFAFRSECFFDRLLPLLSRLQRKMVKVRISEIRLSCDEVISLEI